MILFILIYDLSQRNIVSALPNAGTASMPIPTYMRSYHSTALPHNVSLFSTVSRPACHNLR